MKQFAALLKLELSGILSELSNPGNNKKKGKLGRGIMAAVLILVLAGSLIWFEVRAMDILTAMNSQEVLLKLLVFASMLLTFVYGFLQVLSRLYFSKDIALLSYLPTKDITVYTSKLTGHFIYEVAVSALFILPGTFVYMSRLGFDAALLARALAVTVLSPILPICLCALISGLVTRIPGFWKHKETITTVFTVIMMFSVFFISYFSGRMGGSTADDESMQTMVVGLSSLVDQFVRKIPPIGWGANALTGDGVSMLLLLAVSAASFALVVFLFGRHYVSEASLGTENTAEFKKVDMASLRLQSQSPLLALIRREIREMLRTPAYLVNGLLGPVLMPTMMTVMFMVSFSSAVDGGIPEMLKSLMENHVSMVLITAVLTFLVSLLAGMNSVASTAVSREGKRHGLMMSLPVPDRTIVRSKFLASLFFAAIGILPPPIICSLVIPGFLPYAALMFLWSAMRAYSGTAAGLAIDLGRPRMDWINENQAIKQNMNQILGLLVVFVVLGAAAALVVVLYLRKVSDPVMIAAETACLLAVCFGFRFWLLKAERAYRHIED